MTRRYTAFVIVWAAMWGFFGLILLAWLAYAWRLRHDRPGLLCAAASVFGTGGWWVLFRRIEPAIERRLGPLSADWRKDKEAMRRHMDAFWFSPRMRRVRVLGWWAFVTVIPLLTVAGQLSR